MVEPLRIIERNSRVTLYYRLGLTDDQLQIDLNHPLAGQTVHYSVKIVAVYNENDNDTTEPKTLH